MTGGIQCAARDVDELDIEAAGDRPAALDEPRQFLSAARTELDQVRRPSGKIEDLTRVRVEQALFGASDLIPRQSADGLENRRAEGIVEVAGRQLAWLKRQVILHVVGKL